MNVANLEFAIDQDGERNEVAARRFQQNMLKAAAAWWVLMLEAIQAQEFLIANSGISFPNMGIVTSRTLNLLQISPGRTGFF